MNPLNDPDLARARAILRSTHPSFGRIDEILMALADDPTVSPRVFELVCEAVFIGLYAYADAAGLT